MNHKTLTQKLKELTKALEDRPIETGPSLEVTDMFEQALDHLSCEAAEAIKPIEKTLSYQRNGETYRAMYLSVVTNVDSLDKGLKAICQDLNELAHLGLIKSALSRPSFLKLARIPGSNELRAVFAFVHVPESRRAYAEGMVKHLQADETGPDMSNPIGDITPILGDGEFFVFARRAVVADMFEPHQSNEAWIHDVVQQHLNVLPKGTQLVSITQCTVTDLSVPYEIKFRNPLLKKCREVQIEWVRMCEVIDDSVKQFNLMLGVRYIAHDGKVLWSKDDKR